MSIDLTSNTTYTSASSSNTSKNGYMWQRIILAFVVLALLAAAGLAILHERKVSRDTKRITDVQRIMAALTLYHDDHNIYPESLAAGQSLMATDGTVYITSIPQNPEPGGIPYTYVPVEKNSSFTLNFNLESTVGEFEQGPHTASPQGIK